MGRSARKATGPGQLFLFSTGEVREGAELPPRREAFLAAELKALFDDLNDRFFGGGLIARLEWSERMTTSAGSCNSNDRVIRVSAPYHRRRPSALPVTLAHEMLHLVVKDHGPEFRAVGQVIALALGVSWQDFRYAERYLDSSRYRYVYACPSCGLEYPAKSSRRASCSQCHSGGYCEEFRLILVESRARPGPVLRGERPLNRKEER